ncbi:hypothetical protein B0H11DRAFT_2127429 [Mycena galericulata]|nr:hypothetical protein B0H11DRAFT_2127429 [Mycena galericulata]
MRLFVRLAFAFTFALSLAFALGAICALAFALLAGMRSSRLGPMPLRTLVVLMHVGFVLFPVAHALVRA